MSSILSSQGMVLATAMAAVSGTVILLAFRLQKSFPPSQLSITVNSLHPPCQSPQPLPRSCISSASSSDGKKKNKKKKRVHFAADVVDPIGNSDEYRKKLPLQHNYSSSSHNRAAESLSSSSSSSSSAAFKGGKVQGMPANRVALYSGILRDRVLLRTTYSY
ncbi:uncharacterized protein LOC113775549 [Coffea eugenioides]|uniref:Uncharacterized protein n=1 Tax=Coffea arabica TaxID=13443 RepID=A0A6P6SWT5_COFAR|nr:uncharacterized protein LOC113695394 [Coffea arabica]XP_027176281.1 uncharacterized protein LOC113775549 [Coffea eugenioides]